MFSLIRRISYGVIPRTDRPWEDDPTSNAPHTRRKRRLSSTERDADDNDGEQANKKKARGDSATPSVADADGVFLVPALPVSQEVTEVTQGVEEVVLDGEDREDNEDDAENEEDTEAVAPPESIPLPEAESGELDEEDSESGSVSSSEPGSPSSVRVFNKTAKAKAKAAALEKPSTAVDENNSDDVASSAGEEDATLPAKDVDSAAAESTSHALQPDTAKD
ncbi:hypothetical protein B0H34DRAFT_96849 [Crassisporium funariophilum]|nr:hypothetical protein B0H34DRAFT_96849 [Crassisporium funariophilum]